MKKKAIKIAASTAVAASAFVAAAPAQQADAATNVNQLLTDAQNAGTVLKWAISVEGSADYKTQPFTQYNAAKKAIAAAESAAAKLSASEKLSADAKLVEPKLQVKRAGAYIDAITSSVKIKDLTAGLDAAIKSNDIEKVETAYHKATGEYRKQAALLDRVYGQSTRDGIRNEVKPAIEKLVASVKNEVTVNMLAKSASANTKAGKLEEAAQNLTDAQAILDANVLKWETSLQKSVDDAATAMPLQVLSVARVDANTVTVKFSKATPDVLAAGQFTFDNGLNVHSATVSADKKTVTLTTSTLEGGKTYNLSYQGVATGKAVVVPTTPIDDSFVVDQKDTAYLDLGQTRAYTVSVKNTDGKPFNGPATIDLFQFDGTTASSEVEIVTVDGKTQGVTAAQWTGDIVNGKVIFVVKATSAQVTAGTSTYALPVITLGTDTGNGSTPDPLEAGDTYFVAEAPNGSVALNFDSSNGGTDKLHAHNKTDNYFVAGDAVDAQSDLATLFKYNYDANDIYVNGTLDAFKNALSSGDAVSISYNDKPSNASTFNITSDLTVSTLTFTNPTREVSTEGSTFRFEGTGTPNFKVELFRDVNADGELSAAELASNKVGATATVSSTGRWSIDAGNISAGSNDYIAVQYISGSSVTKEIANGANTEATNNNVSATATATNGKLHTVHRGTFNPSLVTLNDVDASAGISTGDTIDFTFNGTYAHALGSFKTGTITLEQNFKKLVVNVKKIDSNTVEVTGLSGAIPTGFDVDVKTVPTKLQSTTGIINQDKLQLKPSATSAQNTVN
ncbi:hypothetical protein H9650_04130 [Psychrobacillus sp. Sa2BUA9]|uniref:SbsC C-terminal domain-containing protein n=1 Tax=Psychrobacillus faecigallinarum TaxID=2762235 RepID=A0ABR8R679_9BACI|nr:hypothetical protein [Psychrobacillus faecigallinarum]MBD7943298.1 hypothetical protein [Psychrobacillus faecigallinarum]